MVDDWRDAVADLAPRLARARSVAVLTGAGVSAESGIATFRDPETGLWTRVRIDEVATPEAFRRDPARVWAWYVERRGVIDAAQPNDGHRALVAIEHRVPDFTLVTQNIDGLHARAGSRAVVELHGNLRRARCWREDLELGEWAPDTAVPPRCPFCGDLVRPDVVWFGEALPPEAIREAQRAALRAELFLCVGTSAVVEPAASLPFLALRHGATLVEVNPDETCLTPAADYPLRGPAAQVLPALVAAAWPDAASS